MVQITVKKLEETTTLCTEAPATPNVTLQTHNQGSTQTRDVIRLWTSIIRKRLRSNKPKHTSELYKLCCSLSRIQQKSWTMNDSQKCHSITWPVQKLQAEYGLIVPPPYHKDIKGDGHIDLSDFIDKLPESMKGIYHKANPERLINLMLPEGVICQEARKVAATFWLWLCITDDILEGMNNAEFSTGIHDMHACLSRSTVSTEQNLDSQISFVTDLFRGIITSASIAKNSKEQQQWQQSFVMCVQEIAHAFELERPLLKAKNVNLEHWMKLRVVTISARPFMVLAKASLGIPCEPSPMGNPFSTNYIKFSRSQGELESDLSRLETTLQCVLGLQNDILGWEKDHHEGLNLNAVQILIANWGASTDSDYALALSTVIDAHNQLVISLVDRASELVTSNDSRLLSYSNIPGWPLPSLVNSGVATMESTPRSSDDLPPPPTPVVRPVEEVDIVDSDIDDCDDSLLQKTAVAFRLFGRTVKLSWELTRPEYPVANDEAERMRQYINVLLNMANGMATWMISSKRYALTT